MGFAPIKRLIIEMSLPMIISMMVQALYNVVDSIFVARLSEDALTAVTLAFPMQNLMIAVGAGTSVGVNALLSKSLGERRFDRSDKAANMGLLLTVFNGLLFLLIAFTITRPFVSSQTSDPGIIADCITYLTIVTACGFTVFFQIMFEKLLQSTGRTLLSMISQATTSGRPCSCGYHNLYGHPHRELLKRLTSREIAVSRTDRDGTVRVATDGRFYLIRSYISGIVSEKRH